jgi:hypothetical protein
MIHRLYSRLTMLKNDRGEGPVPYIIIVSIIAILAVAVATFLNDTATDWLDTVPEVGDAP